MPAILLPNAEGLWLDPDARVSDLIQLLGHYPEDEMEACPAPRAVNSPGRDEAVMVEPIDKKIIGAPLKSLPTKSASDSIHVNLKDSERAIHTAY